MLLKLTPGVNFANIIGASFLNESLCAKLFCTYILGLNFFDARILA
jgi:hypothetical protein